MAKKKVCKNCRYFYEGDHCPICNSNATASTWQGRLHVLDANKSKIAEKIGLKSKGEYAIKVR
jgi:DNA-directed RNA polymerase subunit E"